MTNRNLSASLITFLPGGGEAFRLGGMVWMKCDKTKRNKNQLFLEMSLRIIIILILYCIISLSIYYAL